MEIIFAPWRYKYVSHTDRSNGCVFCEIINSEEDEKNLLLHRADYNIVVLNKYPYTTGHLMVVPLGHNSEPSAERGEEMAELMMLVTRSIQALKQQYSPHGFNLGMNLGQAGGAGIEAHYHMHVLPRWNGDTNFVSVIGDVRIVPENLEDTFRRLRPAFQTGM